MTAPGLVDTHAHLMDPAFDPDRDEVLSRAHQAAVSALVLVGYDLPTSRAAVELARTLPNARATVGIHPNSAAHATEMDYAAIAELASEPEVVAIGETGFDNYREFTSPKRQRESLEWHLRLASDLRLPVIIHNRQADAEVRDIVMGSGVAGILHCFSSSDPNYLDLMLAYGFFISFAGPLTFKNGQTTRDMARRVPLDRLLVETDCPYLAPEPHRGRRNEPAFVRDTATCLANLVGLSLDVLTAQLWRNIENVFPALRDVAVAA